MKHGFARAKLQARSTSDRRPEGGTVAEVESARGADPTPVVPDAPRRRQIDPDRDRTAGSSRGADDGSRPAGGADADRARRARRSSRRTNTRRAASRLPLALGQFTGPGYGAGGEGPVSSSLVAPGRAWAARRPCRRRSPPARRSPPRGGRYGAAATRLVTAELAGDGATACGDPLRAADRDAARAHLRRALGRAARPGPREARRPGGAARRSARDPDGARLAARPLRDDRAAAARYSTAPAASTGRPTAGC